MKAYSKKIVTIVFAAALLFGFLSIAYFSDQLRSLFFDPISNDGFVVDAGGPDIPSITPNMLAIDSLGVSVPIIEPRGDTEDSYQEALQNGIVHFPGTAQPGELGNAYLFGHSSDSALSGGNYETVFALLPQIENGASILVSNNEGETFKYQVVNKFVVENDDLSVLDQWNYEDYILTLQTSYPIGTTAKRYIVQAVKVNK